MLMVSCLNLDCSFKFYSYLENLKPYVVVIAGGELILWKLNVTDAGEVWKVHKSLV